MLTISNINIGSERGHSLRRKLYITSFAYITENNRYWCKDQLFPGVFVCQLIWYFITTNDIYNNIFFTQFINHSSRNINNTCDNNIAFSFNINSEFINASAFCVKCMLSMIKLLTISIRAVMQSWRASEHDHLLRLN